MVLEGRFRDSYLGKARAETLYKLTLDEHSITFEVTVFDKPFHNSSSGYCEGLWRFDCAELWLTNDDCSKYIECNLAPNGAWWTMVFGQPFERLNIIPPQCTTTSQVTESSWIAALAIPLDEIERAIGTRTPKGNITLVLGGCPDENIPPENLHSVLRLSEPQPAFHRPHDWVPLAQLGQTVDCK
jgi:hypothetical protein